MLKRAKTYDAVRAIATEEPLEKRPIYNSANLFLKHVDLNLPKYCPFLPSEKKYKGLKDLERLSAHNKINLSHSLVDSFHKSGKTVSDFIDDLALSSELRESDVLKGQRVNRMLKSYLTTYNREIAYPLPPSAEDIHEI